MEEGLDSLRRGTRLKSSFVPTMPDPPNFDSARLLKLRISYGLTQPAFARLLKVSPKTIQSWEQGTRRPAGTALRMLQMLESPGIFESMVKIRRMKKLPQVRREAL
ncbi:helix-turn-helix domain-containing protein [Candidatus Sumerlaeota bacterium]|nr:helix-turn-helix domain-containing protein [Candidatus Sumerlaeota bacterium]